MELQCVQNGTTFKCYCLNCKHSQNMYTTNNPDNSLNSLNKPVEEIDFQHNPYFPNAHKILKRIRRRLNRLEDSHDSLYYDFYQRRSGSRNLHLEGGDFGGHSLYENPYVGDRNLYYNHPDYGRTYFPYIQKFNHAKS
jgi:hypothetical protein